jgi:DNA-directed RNA polymerase specialized sigma24 family protein
MNLSLEQTEALRRFSRDAERAVASTHIEKRLDARQSLQQAKAAVPAREIAIVDLVMVRGRSLKALATASGQSVEQLDQLLRQAANSLADHYQTREAA